MPRNYTNNSTNTFIDKIPLSNTCTGKWGGGGGRGCCLVREALEISRMLYFVLSRNF